MFIELPELGEVALTVTHTMTRVLGDDEPDAAAAHRSSVLEARDDELRATTLATAESFVVSMSRLGGWAMHDVLDAVSADVADYTKLLDEDLSPNADTRRSSVKRLRSLHAEFWLANPTR